MSVTPKLHPSFVHLLIFLERVQGFSDLGEDSCQRAHQEEARNDSQVGAVVNIAKKERTKSRFEAMNNSAMVKEKMSDLSKSQKVTSLLMVQVKQRILEWKGN